MLMKDNKKMATIIMAKMGKKPEDQEPKMEDGAEQDDSMALKTAGEEFLQAVESKNPMALVEALKSLMELCESPEQEEAEHEPQEEE
jgi:hypothetical protein